MVVYCPFNIVELPDWFLAKAVDSTILIWVLFCFAIISSLIPKSKKRANVLKLKEVDTDKNTKLGEKRQVIILKTEHIEIDSVVENSDSKEKLKDVIQREEEEESPSCLVNKKKDKKEEEENKKEEEIVMKESLMSLSETISSSTKVESLKVKDKSILDFSHFHDNLDEKEKESSEKKIDIFSIDDSKLSSRSVTKSSRKEKSLLNKTQIFKDFLIIIHNSKNLNKEKIIEMNRNIKNLKTTLEEKQKLKKELVKQLSVEDKKILRDFVQTSDQVLKLEIWKGMPPHLLHLLDDDENDDS